MAPARETKMGQPQGGGMDMSHWVRQGVLEAFHRSNSTESRSEKDGGSTTG